MRQRRYLLATLTLVVLALLIDLAIDHFVFRLPRHSAWMVVRGLSFLFIGLWLYLLLRHNQRALRESEEANRQLDVINRRLQAVTAERRTQEEAVRASKQLYQRLVVNVPGVVFQFQIDAQGRPSFPFMSAKSRDLLGLDFEDIRRDPERFFALVHRDDRPLMEACIAQSHASLLACHWEGRFLVQGGVRWFKGMAQPERQTDGAVRWDGILIDTTDLKSVEEEWRESEEKYRNLVDHALIGIGISQGNRIVFVNRALAHIFGYATPEELLRIPLLDCVAPESRDLIRERMNKRERGEPLAAQYEYRIVRQDGAIRDLEIASSEIVLRGEKYVQSTFRDITEHKRASEALRDGEARYRAIFDGAAEGILIAEAAGQTLQYANPAACRLFGYTAEALVRLRIADLHPADAVEHVRRKIQDHIRLGAGVDMDVPCRRQDGTVFYADINVTRIALDGCPMLVGFFTDITERKAATEALREREARLTEAQQVARLGFYALDIPRARWTSSEVLDDIFGIDAAFRRDIEGWTTLLHPDDRQTMVEYFYREVLEQRRPFDREYRILRRADGQERWVHGLGRLQLDDAGRPVGMFGTIQDVTARKRGELALRASEERYRTLADAAPEMIFVVNGDGCVEYANAWAAHRLRAPPEQIIGRHLEDLFPPHLAARHRQAVRRVIETGQGSEHEVLETFPDGACWIDARLAPLRDADGRIVAALGISRDITERKRAEEQIRASLVEKEVLLKEIHHRVKNNLQVISSLLNLQIGYVKDPFDRDLFNDCQSRVRTMALIHEGLYQSPDLACINFADYLRHVADNLMRTYRADQVRLELDVTGLCLGIDAAIPCGLIVNELVSNALKYAFPPDAAGARGEVPRIRVALQPRGETELVLRVADNGCGLPAAVEVGATPSLGLQLVATLAQQLQGCVTVERAGGTAFQIVFPRPAAATERSRSTTPEP